MRKVYLILFSILFCISASAQITNYGRTVLTGQTYTNFTLATAGPTGDDAGTTVTLPFSFSYNGASYTTVRFSTNGWISFNSSSTSNSTAAGDLFSTATPNNEVAVWHRDNNANGANGGALSSGVHPSLPGVYVFQYQDVASNGSGSTSTTLKFNAQIWLYGPASSNPGRIELRYGAAAAGISTGAGIGIEDGTGGSGHYINALDGSSTSTTTSSAWVGDGNGYRFELPPAGVTAITGVPTSSCPNNSVPISVTIKNISTSTIDFAATNATVTVNITGTVPQTLTVTLANGTLAPNATLTVPVFPNANLSTGGSYTFAASVAVAGSPASGSFVGSTANIYYTLATPVINNFTGFTGGNLGAVQTGWFEAAGTPVPSGTTSTWTSQTGVGTAANVTARVNLFTNNRSEWIISPRFVPTANTMLYYDVAVTDWNSSSAADVMGSDDSVSVMVSADCGATWTRIKSHTVADNLTTSLTTQSVNLGSFAGQTIMVGFKATDGPIDNTEDYDFHLDNINIGDPCSGAPAGGTASAAATSVCYGGTTTFTLAGSPNSPGITVKWQSSLDGVTWVDIPGATSTTFSPATIIVSSQFRALVTCANGGQSTPSTTVSVTVTSPPTYTIIPFTEDFENWINGCNTNDRPGVNWGSAPGTGNNSWRRDDQGVSSAGWTSNSGAYSPVFTTGAHSARFHSFHAPNLSQGMLDLFVNLSTDPNAKLLKFDYINTSGTDVLGVWLSTNGGQTFTQVGTNLGVQGTWATKQFLINSASPTAIIRLLATSDFGGSDIGVDNLQVLIGCTGTPTPGTASIVGPSSICLGNSASLQVTGQTNSAGITYQWQSSPDNTTWTDIPTATNSTYSASPTTNTYYRVRVICSNTGDAAPSTSVQVTVNDPQLISATGATRCGPGTVTLTANASPGATINWYNSATGGAPIGTGSPFVTPIVGATTTYYASATVGGGSSDVGLSPTATGCGSIDASTATDWPLRFNTTAPVRLNSAYLIPQAAGDIVVALRNSLSGTDLQTATFTFTAAQVGIPQQINLGWSIPTSGSYQLTNVSGTIFRIGTYTCTYPFTSSFGGLSIVGSAFSSTSATNTNTYNAFFQLNVTEGCESPRVAAPITINPAPAFDITDNTTVCNNGVTTLQVNSSLAAFNTITWAPTTGLYTDPGATVPYTGGSTSIVFAKVGTAGVTTYVATANNTATSCQNIDSVKLTVLPAAVNILASPSTICTSGTSTLTYSPNTGFGTATAQWYSSADGTTYAPISGSTGTSYTTPTLTATGYYQIRISDAAGNVCLQPTTTVAVVTPQVLTTTPGARCGPGTVTLSATGSAGTTLNWYTSATNGTLVGSGASFTTPSLTQTTTYYVGASSGGAGVNVGLSPLATTCGTINGSTATDWPLRFNTSNPATINSAYIIPNGAGNVTVALRASGSTTDLQTATFTFTAAQSGVPQQISLGFYIPAAGSYQLTNSSGTISRIGTYTCTYPYTAGGFSIVGSATSSTAATNTNTYNTFFQLNISEGCQSPRVAVEALVSGPSTITVQPKNTAVCLGSPATLSVTATGANLSYQWRKGTTNITGATSNTYTINATTAADAGVYNVVITGLCGNVTSQDVNLVVAANNSWLGMLDNNWNNPGNWCGGVPTSTTDIVINAGTPFQPVLSAIGEVRNLTIASGASVTVATGGFLNVYGNLTNNGGFTAPQGIVAFRGAANQTVNTLSAGTVIMNGAGGVTLSGNLTVTTALILTNGNITLGTNNLVLNGSSSGSASSHVITNGTGSVVSNNITGNAVVVPVGPNATSYNPVIISNGQGRNYTVRVAVGITPTINNPARAVNRTWNVTPSTPVSSPVDVVLQFSDADINSSATSTVVMEVGVHNGTTWNIVSPATGVTPSGTANDRQIGMQTTQFGPMVAGNFGALSFPTATANVDADVTSIMIMPNPVQSQTILRVQLRRAMKINWCIIDANGRIVMTFGKQLLSGQNDINLQLSQLAAGTYQIIGSTDKGKTRMVRFIKL